MCFFVFECVQKSKKIWVGGSPSFVGARLFHFENVPVIGLCVFKQHAFSRGGRHSEATAKTARRASHILIGSISLHCSHFLILLTFHWYALVIVARFQGESGSSEGNQRLFSWGRRMHFWHFLKSIWSIHNSFRSSLGQFWWIICIVELPPICLTVSPFFNSSIVA